MNQMLKDIICGTRSRLRPIVTTPAEVLKEFPERSTTWEETYPALIKPWIGGVRAYWLDDLQVFQLEENNQMVHVDGIEPYVPEDHMDRPPCNLLGEFWAMDTTYKEIREQVIYNEPSEDLDFYVFDAEMEAAAIDRAKYYFNLPRQYERHTRIAEVYQVQTPGGFRTHLEGWRRSFSGGLVVGPQDKWLSTEYEVKKLSPLKETTNTKK